MKPCYLLSLALGLFAVAAQADDQWQAPDQAKARKRAHEKVPFVEEVKPADPIRRQLRLQQKGISIKDVKKRYYLLDSPIISKVEDHYEPVRFTHAQHTQYADSCGTCHHHRPQDPQGKEIKRCSGCHQQAFKEDYPQRLGLKAAFHQRCMGCHKERGKGPLGCTSCHLRQVPDHKDLVKLPAKPTPQQVTRECLRCHEQQAKQLQQTAHWRWRGPSPYTVDHRHDIEHGKATTAFNNY